MGVKWYETESLALQSDDRSIPSLLADWRHSLFSHILPCTNRDACFTSDPAGTPPNPITQTSVSLWEERGGEQGMITNTGRGCVHCDSRTLSVYDMFVHTMW